MARIRALRFSGTLSSELLAGATTMMSSALSSFPEVAGSDHAAFVIGAESDSPEIVYVTAHATGATSATVLRGKDGTTDRTWPAGTPFLNGPIESDYPVEVASEEDATDPYLTYIITG